MSTRETDRTALPIRVVTARVVTRAQARRLGWELTRGAYQGTTDDRLDRWYWQRIGSNAIDRTGPGYGTIGEALDALLDRVLGYEAAAILEDEHYQGARQR